METGSCVNFAKKWEGGKWKNRRGVREKKIRRRVVTVFQFLKANDVFPSSSSSSPQKEAPLNFAQTHRGNLPSRCLSSNQTRIDKGARTPRELQWHYDSEVCEEIFMELGAIRTQRNGCLHSFKINLPAPYLFRTRGRR